MKRLTSQNICPDIGTRCESNIYARTYPGPSWPFGIAQPGPDNVTGMDYTNGYSYDLRFIEGFSMMRMSGTGWYGDFGIFQVMPTTGPLQTFRGNGLERCGDDEFTGWHSPFFHRDETIQAGYYSVLLHRYNVMAELTASPHCGIMRFTFPEAEPARIQIDLARRIGGTSSGQHVHIAGDNAIEGWIRCGPEGGGLGNGKPKDLKYTVFYRAEFSLPLENFGVWEPNFPENTRQDLIYIQKEEYAEACRRAEVRRGCREADGEHLGVFAEFASKESRIISVKVGLSFVDIDGARNNLSKEIPDWDFERVREKLAQRWNQECAVLKIDGATETDLKIAATALYHTRLDPRKVTDIDGRFVDGNGNTRLAGDFAMRTVFSGWDAFRSYIPLMTLLDPELVNDQVASLLEVASTTGKGLPKWELMGVDTECMVGDPAVGTIVDAYVKGIRGYDVEKAFQLCLETAFGPRTHRDDWQQYLELGYCPVEQRPGGGITPGVSTTLENCYFDWCIYQFGKTLGRNADVHELLPNLTNYRNLYCPEVGLMRGRDTQGNWIPWKGGTEFGQGCIESNPLQQTWFVPHDPAGLMELMGEEHFFGTLENMFERTPPSCFWNPYYNHSNEPVHQLAYIFACTGRPWLTQKWCRQILKNAYGLGPEGLCGNDDVGQMSAWYLLSAIGIHPFCTGSGTYCIGSPLFREVELALDRRYYKGDRLRIVAHDNCDANLYVQRGAIGGKALNRAWVTHAELTSGETLELWMGPEPNTEWGSAREYWPVFTQTASTQN